MYTLSWQKSSNLTGMVGIVIINNYSSSLSFLFKMSMNPNKCQKYWAYFSSGKPNSHAKLHTAVAFKAWCLPIIGRHLCILHVTANVTLVLNYFPYFRLCTAHWPWRQSSTAVSSLHHTTYSFCIWISQGYLMVFIIKASVVTIISPLPLRRIQLSNPLHCSLNNRLRILLSVYYSKSLENNISWNYSVIWITFLLDTP